ncbi:MAG: tetratricopeptide repeat protein [Deltaproteobacteria bacterium]|nr:tetratricopeptide repeat protein [Deltaproteobacteria bacterium]
MNRVLTFILLLLLGAPAGAVVGCGGGSADVETQVTELPPADPAAVREFRAGNRLMSRGTNRAEQRAIRRFRQAVEIDPYLWEAYYNLGVLYRRRGEMREAITALGEARRIQPGAREPLLALAEVHYALGERDEASALVEAFVDVDPDAVRVRVAYATILRERGEYDGALEQAREALIRESSNADALVEIGRVYRAREQYDVADLVFRKALDLSEDDRERQATLHDDLGLVALARGDTQAAFLQFQEAIQLDAQNKSARMNQGSVLLQAGDYAGAQAHYEAVLAIDEDDLNARVALGICQRGQGDHRQARRSYEGVLDDAPNHPAALFNLAVLKAEFLDQRPASREFFERFLRVAPSDAPQREMAERYLREIPAAAPPRRGRRSGGGAG